MSREKDIITSIASQLPRSNRQLNNLFESDSEIIQFGSKKLLLTIDEFSDEDHFRNHDPYILGWNLAVATISDILASGGQPTFYGHSIIIDKDKWDDSYLEHFSVGIADVLRKSKAFFIGGDVGSSDRWGYTGIAMGETDNALTRMGAKPGDLILITGQIGAGNLEAALTIYSNNHFFNRALKHYKTRLALRFDESKLISQYATSCIDSSDGVLNAVNTVSDLNHTGFELSHTPYLRNGVLACKILSKPKELLLMGECGEYELVFTINKKDLASFLQKSKEQKLSFTQIGKIVEGPGKILATHNSHIDFSGFDISARDYRNVSLYLDALTNYLKNHWNIKRESYIHQVTGLQKSNTNCKETITGISNKL